MLYLSIYIGLVSAVLSLQQNQQLADRYPQFILVSGQHYIYQHPFILKCYQSDNKTINRHSTCSSEAQCLHSIRDYYTTCKGQITKTDLGRNSIEKIITTTPGTLLGFRMDAKIFAEKQQLSVQCHADDGSILNTQKCQFVNECWDVIKKNYQCLGKVILKNQKYQRQVTFLKMSFNGGMYQFTGPSVLKCYTGLLQTKVTRKELCQNYAGCLQKLNLLEQCEGKVVISNSQLQADYLVLFKNARKKPLSPQNQYPDTIDDITLKVQAYNRVDNNNTISQIPYVYAQPFTLNCYNPDQSFYKASKCDSKENCQRILKEFRRCTGKVSITDTGINNSYQQNDILVVYGLKNKNLMIKDYNRPKSTVLVGDVKYQCYTQENRLKLQQGCNSGVQCAILIDKYSICQGRVAITYYQPL